MKEDNYLTAPLADDEGCDSPVELEEQGPISVRVKNSEEISIAKNVLTNYQKCFRNAQTKVRASSTLDSYCREPVA